MPFDGTGFERRNEALDKIDAVIDLLSQEDRWCKQQLRSYDGRRCILGALMAADATVTLKAPILSAIKQVTGRDYLRIEMFNDHPQTNYAMVAKVLDHTRRNIIDGVAVAPVRSPVGTAWWSTPVKSFSRLRQRFGHLAETVG